MRLRPKERKSARHHAPGTVGVHIDPTRAGGLVYETLSAIFELALAPPGAGRIVSDGGGPVVSALPFDVRRQRALHEPVLLSEAVRALVYGRPKDIERLVRGLQEHFTVEDEGSREPGHGEQVRELVIGPRQGG
ncbi:hypothetical protein OG905_08510 [Streptomyces sp. NBC_00322]|uniref:hypothetical protein n=1 Tax=Streptomyces sp. NBC_00322 TaxID=2975712 RepID=UPI002E2D7413|nr:hypothetical protein [Streptomyces sp. NBC_00322]